MESPNCLKWFRSYSWPIGHICPPQSWFLAMNKPQTLKKNSDNFIWKFGIMGRYFVTISLLSPEKKRAWSITSSHGLLIRIATQETYHPTKKKIELFTSHNTWCMLWLKRCKRSMIGRAIFIKSGSITTKVPTFHWMIRLGYADQKSWLLKMTMISFITKDNLSLPLKWAK